MDAKQLITLCLSVEEIMTLRDACIWAEKHSTKPDEYKRLFAMLGNILQTKAKK